MQRSFGYSPESIQRELSNEYQHDRVKMVFKSICVLVHWTKVVLALEGLMDQTPSMARRLRRLPAT